MTPLTLHQYRIDRVRVATPHGIEQGVALIMTDNDMHEHAFAISAVDAKQIGIALNRAANEAQEAKRREQG